MDRSTRLSNLWRERPRYDVTPKLARRRNGRNAFCRAEDRALLRGSRKVENSVISEKPATRVCPCMYVRQKEREKIACT